jgi:lipoyl(octanoyl) transferase
VNTLHIRQLGLQDYETVWQQMRNFTDARDENTADELWLVEHHPVFTLGQAGLASHIVREHTIPVIKSDRGGQVTYHGPGQLVAYTLIDLARRKIGVRFCVEQLEQVLIDALAIYGINAQRQQGAPGVYVNGDKIAALGLRVRRGKSFHGISLNVNMDLQPFSFINPCGYAGMKVVNMQDYVTEKNLTVAAVANDFCHQFAKTFDYKLT